MTQATEADTTRDTLIEAALSKYWGFDTLRPLQREVVDSALNDRDAVVVMPTGGGKSLCFQLPSVVTERLTVVVSPLIALMKDQVDSLTVVGVSAAALNSSMSEGEEADIHQRLESGAIRLLYVSPEKLLLAQTLRLLARADHGRGVARFAIDEAHCISGWGHDFRPEFRQLSRIKEVFPGVPVQAFTATATPQVQRDIAIQLKLERPRKFVGVFDRPNLTYRVVAKDDPVQRTVEAVQRYPGEGVIVYCLSRKDTELLADSLVRRGIPAVAYHAGLPPETRKRVSEDFAQERANIVVATIAFGMGIDRSNVRCVIHECLPKSMEGYQQETGRAGRDGMPSECVLLYGHGDVVRLKRLLSDGERETVDHYAKLLEEVRKFATSHQCRHKTLSEHFGQPYEASPEGCGACDVCLGGMEAVSDSTRKGHQILTTALSLIARGEGRQFGVGHLTAVLLGSQNKTVIERRGDEAEGFGAFKNEPQERVTLWINQMADLGLLEVSGGQYPVVSVPEDGRSSLERGETIELKENVALLAPAATKRSKSSEFVIPGVDRPLFENLREWRKIAASDRSVPAYVIFHDATLMRISAVRPSTVANLRSISGVGDRRAEEFGTDLIRIIKDYARETGVSLDQSLASEPIKAPPPAPSAKSASYASFFRAGTGLEIVALDSKVKASTVWQQLAIWIENEGPESISPWVSEETQKLVEGAITEVGAETLKPIFEHLEEQVPYEVIRVIRAHVFARQRRESKG